MYNDPATREGRKSVEKPAFVVMAGLSVLLFACTSEAPDPSAPDSAEAPPSNRVATSGKDEVAIDQVPPAVLAAARTARPGFVPAVAERETRDGRLYYDIGGRLADGAEVEFDIMQDGAAWRVVETQRDIAFEAAPAPVREAAAGPLAGAVPSRVIESVQADGLVIFEVYAPEDDDPQGRKVEVRWNGERADLLTEEWAH